MLGLLLTPSSPPSTCLAFLSSSPPPSSSRCLVFLSSAHRPAGGDGRASSAEGPGGDGGTACGDYGATSRAAVLADAEALLACYSMGENAIGSIGSPSSDPPSSGKASGPGSGSGSGSGHLLMSAGPSGVCVETGPPHVVVELAFTSSVRFLQPGLLLQGKGTFGLDECSIADPGPRNSWLQRQEVEEAAAAQGLVQWQTNIYYSAGRVVVPAHMDTFICQAFYKKRLLQEFMTELCGDDGRPGGSALRQLPVPPQLYGRPYSDLFEHLLACHNVIPLGLFRPKAENPYWRLNYVATCPAWADVVEAGDRVFVLRPGGEER